MALFGLIFTLKIALAVEQGTLCGKKQDFFVSDRPQFLTSPYYPGKFPPQVQCLWHARSEDGSLIRIDFVEWNMQASKPDTVFGSEQNTQCSLCYLEVTYYDIRMKKGSVKLCGKNPGFIVSNGGRIQIQLHGDKLGNPGLFKLKLTKAKQGEMPRLIATDGSGVVNGKEKNPVRPVKPRYPVSPVSLYPISSQPTNSDSNADFDESDSPKESRLKKIMPLLYILPIIAVVLLCCIKKSKKSENDVNT